jgi:hypothetical protein
MNTSEQKAIDSMVGQIRQLKPGITEAVDAMLEMCEAIHDNSLSVNDLADGCRLAIGGGHEMALIQLAMMSMAVRLDFENKGKRNG